MRRKLWLFPALLICINFWHNICAVSAQTDAEEEKEIRPRFSSSKWIENPQRPADVIDLSYKECSNNGTCKVITKFVKETPFRSQWQLVHLDEELRDSPLRTKRRIFGVDNRLRIRSPYTRTYPFSSTVAVRVGHGLMPTCSGIALTRSLFLTAAHCLLSSTGKLQVSKLTVGILQRNDTLKWTRVNKIKLHVIWNREKESRRTGKKNNKKFRHDYAVLKTVTPLDVAPMTIAAVGENNEGKEMLKSGKTYMHFSAFDDKLPFVLRYRFCKMEKVTRRKIFSKCDTVPKTAGAGVYVLMRNSNTGKVERKVIAIETGDYKTVSRNQNPFSSSLRITRLQFAQICYWVTNDYNKCSGMEMKYKPGVFNN